MKEAKKKNVSEGKVGSLSIGTGSDGFLSVSRP